MGSAPEVAPETGREDALSALSQGPSAPGLPVRLAIGLGLGILLDVAVFQMVWQLGGGLAAAHLAGFYSAAGLSYLLNRIWVFRVDSGGQSLRMLVIALFAVLLRGAMIGVLVERAGWSVPFALLAGIAAASLVYCVGAAWFVLVPACAESPRTRWRKWAVALFAYAFCLRLFYSGSIELFPQEAYYWNYAQHPALSYFDHPPMVGWIIWLGTGICGDSEFGVRIGTMVASLVTAGCLIALSRNLFGRGAAMGAAILSACLPFLLMTGFLATPDAPLAACWAGTLFFLERAILGEQRLAWLGAGVCLGLGLLSKYTIVLLVPATLLVIALDRRSRVILRRPDPYVAVALALLIFAPVLVWNARNDWASFAFQGARRLSSDAGFSLPGLIMYAMILLTPPGFVLALRFSVYGSAPPTEQSRRRRLFVAAVTLFPLSVFVLYSLTHSDCKLNWTVPIWLGVVPGMAHGLCWAWNAASRPVLARAWRATLILCLLAIGTIWHALSIGIPGASLPHALHVPIAWEEMAREVDLISAQVEAETGKQPLVVDASNYQVASMMAYYGRNSRNGVAFTCGSSLFGGGGVMFRFWIRPEDHAGEQMVLVGMKYAELAAEQRMTCFSRLSPIHERPIVRNGQTLGRFFYRIGHNYDPS